MCGFSVCLFTCVSASCTTQKPSYTHNRRSVSLFLCLSQIIFQIFFHMPTLYTLKETFGLRWLFVFHFRVAVFFGGFVRRRHSLRAISFRLRTHFRFSFIRKQISKQIKNLKRKSNDNQKCERQRSSLRRKDCRKGYVCVSCIM